MRFYFFCLSAALNLAACQEEQGHQPLKDGEKPAPPAVESVENYGGGAVIKYTITDPHTLYVLAEYSINSETVRSSKSSKFKDSVLVSGFNKAGKFDVLLYGVGESEKRSEPVKVEVNPGTPPVTETFITLKAEPAFGGIFITGTNEMNADLVIETMTKNDLGKWESLNMHYTNAPRIAYAIRGLENKEREFAFSVRDRWLNYSDTLYNALEPLFESKVDMSAFAETNLPGDDFAPVAATWSLKQMFDGTSANPTFGTVSNLVFPIRFTIHLRGTYQLSRIKLWQRQEANRIYNSTNVKRFRVWGSMDPNSDGSFDSSWTLLGEFENIKPSGSVLGVTTSADISQAAAGEDYEFEKATIPVRYIRFQALETWGNIPALHIAEMEFYGVEYDN